MSSVKAQGPDGKEITFTGDRVLVAVGRRPFTAGLGLESAGVTVDARSGRVEVNDQFRTSAANVYAIGDLIAGPMLAHKASEEGVVFAERLTGMKPHINYDAIPSVIYIWPEVAAVGKTEEELKEKGIEYRVGSNTLALAHPSRTATDTPMPPGTAALQLAFRVAPTQVDECADELTRLGVALLSPPTNHKFGHRTLFFRDPDGNLLEIYAEI